MNKSIQVSVAYVARTTGTPRAGSDAAAVVSIPLASLGETVGEFAFDHGQVCVLCVCVFLFLFSVDRAWRLTNENTSTPAGKIKVSGRVCVCCFFLDGIDGANRLTKVKRKDVSLVSG